MREHYDQLTSTGAQVIVILPSNRSLLQRFIDEFGPYPYQIYGDPKRILYRKMGHESMAKWKLLLKAGKAFMKGGKKAFLPGDEKQREIVKESMKTQDVYIQGGSWIFDKNGSLLWRHIDKSPEDHASIPQLMEQLSKQR